MCNWVIFFILECTYKSATCYPMDSGSTSKFLEHYIGNTGNTQQLQLIKPIRNPN